MRRELIGLAAAIVGLGITPSYAQILYGNAIGPITVVKSGNLCKLVSVHDQLGDHVGAILDPLELTIATAAFYAGQQVKIAWAASIDGVVTPYYINCPTLNWNGIGPMWTEYNILNSVTTQ